MASPVELRYAAVETGGRSRTTGPGGGVKRHQTLRDDPTMTRSRTWQRDITVLIGGSFDFAAPARVLAFDTALHEPSLVFPGGASRGLEECC